MNKALLPFLLLMTFGCGVGEQSENSEIPTEVAISSPSYYVFVGDSFYLDVYPLAAGNWSNQLTFHSSDSTVVSRWENRVLKLSVPVTTMGFKKLEGALSYSNLKAASIEFNCDYVVAEPTVAARSHFLILNEKNELNISVSGYQPPFDFQVQGADISGSGLNFIIIPHHTGLLQLGILEKGTDHVIGVQEFTVCEKK
jgi:hypothetical protein